MSICSCCQADSCGMYADLMSLSDLRKYRKQGSSTHLKNGWSSSQDGSSSTSAAAPAAGVLKEAKAAAAAAALSPVGVLVTASHTGLRGTTGCQPSPVAAVASPSAISAFTITGGMSRRICFHLGTQLLPDSCSALSSVAGSSVMQGRKAEPAESGGAAAAVSPSVEVGTSVLGSSVHQASMSVVRCASAATSCCSCGCSFSGIAAAGSTP